MSDKQYTWNAADYASHSSQQQAWARELIAKLALKGDEMVLDIGCGDGKITAEIAALLPGGSAIGIDSSEGMIALAQQSFPPRSYPNLLFRTADARALPFREEFTVVFSNATLHWIPDQIPVLHGIARSLKHGGRILLQMGGKGNGAYVVSTFERLMSASRWSTYFAGFVFPYGFYGPEEYAQWLRQAGLSPLRVELIPKDMVHAGKAGLAGWIRTTWLPYTQRVPEQEQDHFIADLVDAYVAEHPLDEQGRVHVKMVRLEVEAVKGAP
jgi:trans-aconitate 2-methyltransferase